MRTVITFIILFIYSPLNSQINQFYFNNSKPIKRSTIEAYLAKGITMQSALDYITNTGSNNEVLDLIRTSKPKYINRADAIWALDWKYCPWNNRWTQLKKMAEDIHNIDPEIILEAGLMEALQNASSNDFWTNFGNDPEQAYVLQAWGLTSPVTLKMSEMVYPETKLAINNGHISANDPNFWYIPDISRLQTRLWFYYRACEYIKCGFESIHMGRMDLMLKRDPGNLYVSELVNKIREFAKTINPITGKTYSRRGVVFLNDIHLDIGEDEYFKGTLELESISNDSKIWEQPDVFFRKSHCTYIGNTDTIIWDWGSSALNIVEDLLPPFNTTTAVPSSYLKNAILAKSGDPSISWAFMPAIPYGLSLGGKHPQGWECDHLPYYVEWDIAGIIKSNVQFTPTIWNEVYSLHERAWLLSIPNKEDRKNWIKYGYQRVQSLDRNAFFLMPGLFSDIQYYNPSANINTPYYPYPFSNYIANNNNFNLENTFREIWYMPKYNPSSNEHFYSVNKRDGSKYPTFSWKEKLYSGDFNRDGKNDILVTANHEAGVTWQGYKMFQANENGDDFDDLGLYTSIPHPCIQGGVYISWGEQLYVGDFDGDGYRDEIAVTPNKTLNISCPNGVNFYKSTIQNNKFNGFQYMGNIQYPSWGEKLYIGDFNRDTKDDILFTANNDQGVNINWDGFKIIYNQFSNSSIQFSSPIHYIINQYQYVNPSWGEKFYIGDFNGDGFKDEFFVIANNQLGINWQGLNMFQVSTIVNNQAVFQDIGILTCSPAICFPSWGENYYIGDFNNDSKDDIIITANNNVNINWQGYRLLLNNYNFSNYSFVDKGLSGCNDQLCFPSWGERFTIGDFNNDGYDDFIVTANKTINILWEGWEMFWSRGVGGIWKQNAIKTIDYTAVNKKSLTIYPNPANSFVTIRYTVSDMGKVNMYLSNISGSTILHIVNCSIHDTGNFIKQVDISNIPNGIYQLNFINKLNKSTQKLQILHKE